jgi:hypothetical protein
VLHEGGHAKDFAGRTYKGTYAFFGSLPLASLYLEGLASSDAVSYLRSRGEAQGEKRAYPLLYGAYSTYIGGEALQFYTGPENWIQLATLPLAWVGNLVGRVRALAVPAPSAPPEPQAAPAEAQVPDTEVQPAPEAVPAPEPEPDTEGGQPEP